ncbi:MAG: restriction endonuclease subunit S [Thermodesulfovibrionales bacterium]
MSPERLLQNFNRLIDTPDAVPRLRRFILDLAVRGKLVEQNPEDEPAAELVKRIEAEKKRHFGGSDKKTQSLDKDQIPFAIPHNWQWTQLAQIGVINPRNDAEDSTDASFVPMPLIFAEYGRAHQHEVRSWSEIKKGFTHFAEGDVGLAKITPCFENGKSTVFRNLTGRLGAGTTELHIVRPVLVLPDYILLYLKTLFFIETGIPKMTGTAGQKRVPKDYFSFSPFPLPPLAEQYRIVAKVDELMKLCDELEAAQTKRERRRDRLVAATLHGLNNGDSESATSERFPFEESARFYFNHLPRLTTRPEHIQQLRQTILNLAVRGMLVPQEPTDGSADELLGHIEAEKKRLVAEGKFRGDTQVCELRGESQPLKLPPTWVWVRFGSIVISRDGERIPVSKEERNRRAKVYDYYGASGVIDKIDGFLFDKPLLLIGEDGANLINRASPIAFIARGKYWVNNHAHVLDGIYEGFLKFLELYINAIDLKPYVTGTAQPKMNQAKMNSIPIALPPEAEQHRIVVKVDELMTLCDELEDRISATTTIHRQFLEATLHEAINTPGELKQEAY